MKTTQVKVVFESYAIRDEDGHEKFRLITRERAEIELELLCEYYERHSLAFNFRITKELAVVECEVVRRRYSKSFTNAEMAGKTYYRLYRSNELVREIDHEPKPLDVINAYAPGLDWKIED